MKEIVERTIAFWGDYMSRNDLGSGVRFAIRLTQLLLTNYCKMLTGGNVS